MWLTRKLNMAAAADTAAAGMPAVAEDAAEAAGAVVVAEDGAVVAAAGAAVAEDGVAAAGVEAGAATAGAVAAGAMAGAVAAGAGAAAGEAGAAAGEAGVGVARLSGLLSHRTTMRRSHTTTHRRYITPRSRIIPMPSPAILPNRAIADRSCRIRTTAAHLTRQSHAASERPPVARDHRRWLARVPLDLSQGARIRLSIRGLAPLGLRRISAPERQKMPCSA